MSESDIDLVVINYKTYDHLQRFLDSYLEFESEHPLTVIDVCGERVIEGPWRYLTTVQNIGYAKACNFGATLGSSDVAFFNADTEFVNDDCVASCLDLLHSDPQIGAVGPLQYDLRGRVTHGGITGDNLSRRFRGWLKAVSDEYRDVMDVPTISGSAYFAKRTVWDELTNCPKYRQYDPSAQGAFLQTRLYFEETFADMHCRHHGYRVVYNGQAEMVHNHSQSPNPHKEQLIKESQVKFREACQHLGIEAQ